MLDANACAYRDAWAYTYPAPYGFSYRLAVSECEPDAEPVAITVSDLIAAYYAIAHPDTGASD